MSTPTTDFLAPAGIYSQRRMRVGLFTVVRDEAPWISTFLAHHRAVGVERAYVYLDRCTDGTAEALAGHDWVIPVPWDRPEDCRWLSELHTLVGPDALARAEADGLDWLALLDVDEFAWGGPPGSLDLDRFGVDRMLSSIPDEVDAVRMATVEVVPERGRSTDDLPGIDLIQPLGRYHRSVEHPVGGDPMMIPGRIGHGRGKAIARVGRGLQVLDSHTWGRATGEPGRELARGSHLHLVAVDGDHWRAKYTKLAGEATWPDGTAIPEPKATFLRTAQRLGPEAARTWFDRCLAVGTDEVEQATSAGLVRRWPLLATTTGRRQAPVGPRLGAGSARPSAASGSGRSDPPVVFIGLDAVDPDVVDQGVVAGRLPTLARLADAATVVPTEAPAGLFTGAVWPSVWTAAHPGIHGYHCWQQIEPGTYDIEPYEVLDRGLGRTAGLAGPRRLRPARRDRRRAARAARARHGGAQVAWGGHDSESAAPQRTAGAHRAGHRAPRPAPVMGQLQRARPDARAARRVPGCPGPPGPRPGPTSCSTSGTSTSRSSSSPCSPKRTARATSPGTCTIPKRPTSTLRPRPASATR